VELYWLRLFTFVAAITVAFVAFANGANAQSLFEALGRLFGGGPRIERSPEPNPTAPDEQRVLRDETGGPSKVFCVRLCDGAFFPLSTGTGKTEPAQLCKSLCPAAATEIYRGSQIDYAVSPRGASYSNLEKAFLYREQITPKCTCTGTTGGTATIAIESDPTLRPGDFVVTEAGVKRFNGSREFPYRENAFSPARLDNIVPVSQQHGPGTTLRVHPRRNAEPETAERD
jgi:hypothetical protein